ncbi:hypothetical protein LTR95_004870 [Oleoguttula sp. CCFEE 5521]
MDSCSVSQSAADTLTARIRALPQELQDAIRSFTFELGQQKCIVAGQAQAIIIDRLWRPPSTLQVNRATRKACAQIYYSCNIFEFGPDYGFVDSTAWLKQLPPSHVNSIVQIRVQNVEAASLLAVRLECPAHLLDLSDGPAIGMDTQGWAIRTSSEWRVICDAIAQFSRQCQSAFAPLLFTASHPHRWRVDTKIDTRLRFRAGASERVYGVWMSIANHDCPSMLLDMGREYREQKAADSVTIEAAEGGSV